MNFIKIAIALTLTAPAFAAKPFRLPLKIPREVGVCSYAVKTDFFRCLDADGKTQMYVRLDIGDPSEAARKDAVINAMKRLKFEFQGTEISKSNGVTGEVLLFSPQPVG